MEKAPLTKTEALGKLIRYCAYQDRCESQVRQKLMEIGAEKEDIPAILAYLAAEKYLDEARFVRGFVRSRHYQKKWAKAKIAQHLKALKCDKALVQNIIAAEIPEDASAKALETVLEKKSKTLSEKDPKKRKEKLVRHALSRGFGLEEVLKGIDQLLNLKEGLD